MKTAVVLLASACLAFAGEIRLGKALTLKDPVAVQALLASPEKYTGKLVQVKGTVRDVCQMMGCWMEITDASSPKAIRIKVKDGEIVFPESAMGKTAIAEGTFVKLELTKEQAIAQAKHDAEEKGRKFDPASVKGPVTSYQIQGAGAVIIE